MCNAAKKNKNGKVKNTLGTDKQGQGKTERQRQRQKDTHEKFIMFVSLLFSFCCGGETQGEKERESRLGVKKPNCTLNSAVHGK